MNTRLQTGLLAGSVAIGLFAAAAAQTPERPGATRQPAPVTAKPTYGVVAGEKGPYLVGEVAREDVLRHFPAWSDTARAYAPDTAQVAALAGVQQPIEIVCVMGTWCGDSQREVPRLWRVLEAAANPRLRLTMLAVGRKDDLAAQDMAEEIGCPRDLRSRWDVTLVPTFIFLDGERELGRIVETPRVTLEADAAAILADVADAAAEAGGWR